MVNTLNYKRFIRCPQGSVLGPTLFLIFVNDVDTLISSHIQKFADDCKVYLSVPSEIEIATLQQDISNLCQWSKDWQMVFNVRCTSHGRTSLLEHGM